MNIPLAIRTPRTPIWLKRIGLAGFAFFFVKGLAWLIVPWLLHAML